MISTTEPPPVYDSQITIKKNGTPVGTFTVNADQPKAVDIPVPSNTSDIVNDSGFITVDAIPSNISAFNNDVGYITEAAIPSNVTAFNNDAGYITEAAIPSQVTAFENDAGYITSAALPTKVSELENDSGFITEAAIPSNISSFNNDSGYITENAIPSTVGAFQNDVGYLTSVSWEEVQDKPDVALTSDIPSKVSELDNDEGFITAEALPSKVSELENDAGYITASAIPAVPSNVSAFNNDAGYITANSLPTKVSELQNDVGYITASQVPPVPSNLSEYNNNVGFITASAIPSNVSAFNNDIGFITASAIPSNVGAFTNDVGYLTASDVSTSALYPSASYSAYVQIDDYGEVNAKKLVNETGVWFIKAIMELYTTNPVTGYWVSPPKITDNGTNLLVEFCVQDKERKYEPQKITYDAASSLATEMLIAVSFHNVSFRVMLKKSTQADIPLWIDCGRLVRDGDANTGLMISQLLDDIGLVHDISDKRDLTDLSYSGKDEDAFFLGVGSFTIELPDTWTATEQKTWVLDQRQRNATHYKLWYSAPGMFYINTLNDATFYIMDISSNSLGSFTWNQVKGGNKVAVTITYQGVQYSCNVQANWETTNLATGNDVVKMNKVNNLLQGENIRINTNGQSNIGILVANQSYNGYALTQSGIAKYDSNAVTKAFNFPSDDATGSTFATREWVQSQGGGMNALDYISITIEQDLSSDSNDYELGIYNVDLNYIMTYHTNYNQDSSGTSTMNFFLRKPSNASIENLLDNNGAGTLSNNGWYVEYGNQYGVFTNGSWDNEKLTSVSDIYWLKVFKR